MNWKFTPIDVLKGKVEYTLGKFRDDLREEVAERYTSETGDPELVFNLVYDTCYWLATDSTLGNLVDFYGGSVADINLLEVIAEDNKENVEMLKAIIKRRYSNAVDAGLTQAEALRLLVNV